MTFLPRFSARALAVLFSVSLAASFSQTTIARAGSEEQEREEAARIQNNLHVVPAPKGRVTGQRIQAISTTVVNFSELARLEALHVTKGPLRALDMEALDNHLD